MRLGCIITALNELVFLIKKYGYFKGWCGYSFTTYTIWPGVIVGIRYATFLISFINHGVKEIDKNDTNLDEVIPENVSEEIETFSDVEKSL